MPKISIVLAGTVLTLVFLFASGSIVGSYNQAFGHKGVHRGHSSYHDPQICWSKIVTVILTMINSVVFLVAESLLSVIT